MMRGQTLLRRVKQVNQGWLLDDDPFQHSGVFLLCHPTVFTLLLEFYVQRYNLLLQC